MGVLPDTLVRIIIILIVIFKKPLFNTADTILIAEIDKILTSSETLSAQRIDTLDEVIKNRLKLWQDGRELETWLTHAEAEFEKTFGDFYFVNFVRFSRAFWKKKFLKIFKNSSNFLKFRRKITEFSEK